MLQVTLAWTIIGSNIQPSSFYRRQCCFGKCKYISTSTSKVSQKVYYVIKVLLIICTSQVKY